MKTTHKLLATLITTTVLVGAAHAMGPGCEMMGGPGGQQMGQQGGKKFDPTQRMERHLDSFKKELKITPEQEPLWQAYADKMKAEMGKGRSALQAQGDEKLSAPEHMAKHQAQMEERVAAMKSVNESFSRLYAALGPEQKALADQHVARLGQAMGKNGARGERGGMMQRGSGGMGPGQGAQKPQS